MRIDNGSADVIMHFGIEGHDWDDPGNNPPIDICADCWIAEVCPLGLDELAIDHPPYTDGVAYYCFVCRNRLTADDEEVS